MFNFLLIGLRKERFVKALNQTILKDDNDSRVPHPPITPTA